LDYLHLHQRRKLLGACTGSPSAEKQFFFSAAIDALASLSFLPIDLFVVGEIDSESSLVAAAPWLSVSLVLVQIVQVPRNRRGVVLRIQTRALLVIFASGFDLLLLEILTAGTSGLVAAAQ